MKTPSRFFLNSSLSLCLLVTLSVARAAPPSGNTNLTLNAIDAGHYTSTGDHSPFARSYDVGDGFQVWRNFFVFDIPVFAGELESARLDINTYGFSSPTGVEFYNLRPLTTPVAALTNGGVGLTSIYTDLGDGVILGSRSFTLTDAMRTNAINLNTNFLTSVRAARGGLLAIGGQITSLDATNLNNELVFSGSLGNPGDVQLVLTFVPDGPPTIINHPQSRLVAAGETTSFNVLANGVGPLRYQWWLNSAPLPEATNVTVSVINATPAVAGQYFVVVTNVFGAVTSAPAALSVAPLVITSQPASQTVLAGSYVYLSVDASSSVPLQYQWYHDGAPMPNQIGPGLGIANAQAATAGDYVVVVQNQYGAVTSAVATVTITFTAPQITTQPTSLSILWGHSVSFSGYASGAPFPSFHWQKNGTNIPGANFYNLYFPYVTPAEAGDYTLVASNSVGSVTSLVATLTVTTLKPVFFTHPTSQTALLGGNAYFYGYAEAGPPAMYEWHYNGVPIPGATYNSLSFYVDSLAQAGNYTLVASNSVGVSTSAVAVLTVTTQAPEIVQHPYDATVLEGQSAYFYAYASGGPPPTFQWLFNGALISGATSYNLSVFNVTPANAGNYSVVASNIYGSATSQVAVLTVTTQAPIISQHPYGFSVYAGNLFSLYASAYAGPPPTYQWYFNDALLPGATNQNLTVPDANANHTGNYFLIASNPYGSATSIVATITVLVIPPSFYGTLTDQVAVEGARVDFYGYASGAPAPDYYWLFNGQFLSTAPLGQLKLFNVTTNEAGQYSVVASNYIGSVTSTVATLTITPAGPLDKWTLRNPLPQGNQLFGVGHGNGTFVGVGDGGTLITSTNGSNWVARNSKTDRELREAGYGNGLHVVVGEQGTILTSPDAVNWAYRFTELADEFSAIAYGNGLCVAAGGGNPFYYSPVVLTSPDGANWSRQVVGANFRFVDLIHANGLFVGVSDYGDGSVLTSPDGTNWTQHYTGTNVQLHAITYGASRFVVVGASGVIATSADAVNWTVQPGPVTRRLTGVAYGNDRFVVAGVRGTVLHSSDGITWTKPDSGTPDRMEDLAFGGGVFISVGENGTIIATGDGVNWGGQNHGPTEDLDGIAAANGLIVAVGKHGMIVTTTDGLTVTPQASGVTNDLHGIVHDGGQFVVVGTEGTVVRSSNAVDWIAGNTGVNNYHKSIAHGNDTYVVVGTGGVILTSTNAVDWTSRASGVIYDLQDVTFGDGRFVAVGDKFNPNGTILVSTDDGLTWVDRSVNIGKNLRAVTHANGLYIAIGNDGSLLTSYDASNWRSQITGIFGDGANLRGITYTNGYYVVVGNDGLILTSPNGTNWTQRVYATPYVNLHGLRYLNGTFVAIGNGGTLLQSGSILPVLGGSFGPGGFQLKFAGEANRAYRLQVSTDLPAWFDLLRFTNPLPTTTFSDPGALNTARRFFRVVSP